MSNRKCTYCYSRDGHNRATCQKLKQDALQGNYSATRILERKASAQANPQCQDRVSSGKKNHCRKCGVLGHNATSCPREKERIALANKQQAEAKEYFIKACQEHGLGVGTLIEVKGYYLGAGVDQNIPKTGMVIALDFDCISHPTIQGAGSSPIRLKIPGVNSHTYVALPYEKEKGTTRYPNSMRSIRIVSRLSTEAVRKQLKAKNLI
mgnify:CR=1 FL=1